MGWITVLLLVLLGLSLCRAYYLSDSWSMISSGAQSHSRCQKIPANLTICKGIQYSEMRLPNLLEHETLNEVVDQARDFQSLLNLNCHSDTQLFLCSVFAPVCLPHMDKAILPCRSLCIAIQEGCEGRMKQYGFPWPSMLQCSQYPEDNDMCIKGVSTPHKDTSETPCESCTQVGTYENIIDNFCRAQLVVKGKIGIRGADINIRNARSLKKNDKRRSIPDTVISLSAKGACPCELQHNPNQRYLIMASKDDHGSLVASLILPWKKDKNFKRAVHQFARLNCKSLGREIRASASRRPNSYYAMRRHNTPDTHY